MSSVRLARALWTAWAVVVWNVVFDHVVVLAARAYVHAASLAASDGSRFAPPARVWMRPAVWRGVWIATGAAAAILAFGFVSIELAARALPDR